ncbi:uncharacterized protein LOC133625714 [Colius striatus]|uniref:uncharacterized protein LOC133625714 n=1 Tax=Colius striatus TaxID=57412 RepID=UPI002B1E191A|nr:uncharacterized protein LOC133625714 [Colius striatus]
MGGYRLPSLPTRVWAAPGGPWWGRGGFPKCPVSSSWTESPQNRHYGGCVSLWDSVLPLSYPAGDMPSSLPTGRKELAWGSMSAHRSPGAQKCIDQTAGFGFIRALQLPRACTWTQSWVQPFTEVTFPTGTGLSACLASSFSLRLPRSTLPAPSRLWLPGHGHGPAISQYPGSQRLPAALSWSLPRLQSPGLRAKPCVRALRRQAKAMAPDIQG